jgi:hypothetical protein
MNNKNASPFKVLQIIHGALCLGPTLFLAVTTFLNSQHAGSRNGVTPNSNILIYIAVIFAAMLTLMSNFLYHKIVQTIDLSLPLNQKFMKYQSACIVRYAMIEGAALFNVVVWFLTGNSTTAFVAAALIGLMIAVRPVKSKIVTLLQVSYPDTLD